MKELIIPFATAVGYMLKVLKSNVKIDKFNPEFKMIRHGNYFEFINSVKGEIPHSVVYNKGKIISDNIARMMTLIFWDYLMLIHLSKNFI